MNPKELSQFPLGIKMTRLQSILSDKVIYICSLPNKLQLQM